MSKSRPVRPTRKQKELIGRLRLNPEQYLVRKETGDTLILYNKHTGKTITRYKKG